MCTVITIAHRLNTVIDSDKVLVMDRGTMVEYDHPHNLLKDKNGFLYKMVEQTGPTNAEFLHSVASEVLEISISYYILNTNLNVLYFIGKYNYYFLQSYKRMVLTKESLIKS